MMMLFTLLTSFNLGLATEHHEHHHDEDLLEVLTERTQTVVRGVVVHASSTTGADGLQTQCTLAPVETLSGPSVDEVIFHVPGGKVPGLGTQRVSGIPLCGEGDEFIVFVPSQGLPPLKGILKVNRGDIAGGWWVHQGNAPRDVRDLKQQLKQRLRQQPHHKD